MKQFVLVIIGILGISPWLFSSCEDIDGNYSNNPNYKLSFSTDTLSFDTVFTTISSATKEFVVYNKNKEALQIQTIMLASGGTSGFRLNVDGRNGDLFENVGILAEDSMSIFVEVTVNPNEAKQPLLIEDSVVFLTNGGKQTVLLEAYGQNMHLYKKGLIIHADTTLTSDLPHVVYDSIRVKQGATLRLAAGTMLYLHHQAKIVVEGTLLAEGTQEQPVVIRGDRLDDVLDGSLPYDRTPGQWGGIFFTQESYGNRFDYAIIRNGTDGVTLEPSDPSTMKLEICNSQITNMQGNVFTATNSKAEIVNTELSNAMGSVVALLSGDYRFIHCTLVNEMQLLKRTASCLSIANHYINLADSSDVVADLKVNFENSIIDGSYGPGTLEAGGEIFSSFEEGAKADYEFNHCVLTTTVEPDEHFRETQFVTKEKDLYYKQLGKEENEYLYDFRLDTIISLGVGQADPEIAAQYPVDRLGVSRTDNVNGPTVGAYEFVQE